LPIAHDALSARMIEIAGFTAYGIGGSAVAVTQLGLPDVGLQSFGEYRDAVARMMEASALPVMVDGENGFGDVKSVVRTVRSFERLGVAGLVFEDAAMPRRLGRPQMLDPPSVLEGKLEAALAARTRDDLKIVARTDAAYAVNVDEALTRAACYAQLDIDGLIVPGLPDLDAYRALRDRVRIPIIAIVLPRSPWFAPSLDELTEIGIEVALFPGAILGGIIAAIRDGLTGLLAGVQARIPCLDPRDVAQIVGLDSWTAIDERSG
jgi:2-methylisocitrate lyase-like PEP mutase family enzyme